MGSAKANQTMKKCIFCVFIWKSVTTATRSMFDKGFNSTQTGKAHVYNFHGKDSQYHSMIESLKMAGFGDSSSKYYFFIFCKNQKFCKLKLSEPFAFFFFVCLWICILWKCPGATAGGVNSSAKYQLKKMKISSRCR